MWCWLLPLLPGESRAALPGPEGGPGQPRALTYVAVVHPDAVAIIATSALHDVVGEIGLWDLVVGVNDNLRGIKSEEAAESLLGHPVPGAQGSAEASLASRAGGCHGRCQGVAEGRPGQRGDAGSHSARSLS